MSRGFINAITLTQDVIVRNRKLGKILVVGSGNGYELVWFGKGGYDVTGLELYVPEVEYVKKRTIIGSAEDMPFEDKEFGLVFCTEMFEHVTEEAAGIIMKEFRRVSKSFYVTIATKDDKPYCTHINVRQGWWWMEKFHDMGFRIENAQINAAVILIAGGVMTRMNFIDGVTIYGDC